MPINYARNGQIRSNNTTLSDTVENGERIVRCTLHKTVIATHNQTCGTVHLHTGGWNTPTTTRRMNECLNAWGFWQRVSKSSFAHTDTLMIDLKQAQ